MNRDGGRVTGSFSGKDVIGDFKTVAWYHNETAFIFGSA
jgi:hypothetical protein